MKIFIRADSSGRIGGGRVTRCLTLAERLRRDGCDVTFISRELPGNILPMVESRGFRLRRLPFLSEDETGYEGCLGADWRTDAEETIEALKAAGGADWVIVDHYSLDWKWESEMRPHTGQVMVIDDLADRRHDCDLLLDQNLHDLPGAGYDSLLPDGCVKLLGPRYALLRDIFVEARKYITRPGREARRVLVSFEGADPTGETIKCIEALRMLDRPGLCVDVVTEESNPMDGRIKSLCGSLPGFTHSCQAHRMPELMLKADIAIGAAGTAAWERCCLGLPSIVVAVAAGQTEGAKALAERDMAVNLGWHEDVKPEKVRAAAEWLLGDPRKRMQLSENGINIVDGAGTDRVALIVRYKRDSVSAI